MSSFDRLFDASTDDIEWDEHDRPVLVKRVFDPFDPQPNYAPDHIVTYVASDLSEREKASAARAVDRQHKFFDRLMREAPRS